jgi:hypothetical protein
MRRLRNVNSILLVVGCLMLLHTGCNNNSKTEDNSAEMLDTSKTDDTAAVTNVYHDMRDMALNMTMEQTGVKLQPGKKIYGIVMDWDVGDGTATLITFISGDASLYLSSGGAIIGGGGHDNIKLSAKAFINKAEKYLDKTSKTDSTALPGAGMLKFYFLTADGKYVAQEEMSKLDNNSSQWLDLFEEANKVITEIRSSVPEK